tara:strand:- start:1238 stop:1465 length:228 start_codon:yes stop_codon:yes gene_type:complete
VNGEEQEGDNPYLDGGEEVFQVCQSFSFSLSLSIYIYTYIYTHTGVDNRDKDIVPEEKIIALIYREIALSDPTSI